MPVVPLDSNMSPSRRTPRSQQRLKATLFCPDCGHESHVTGEWVVRTTAERVTTDCPDCGTRIDDRPWAGEPSDRPDSPNSPASFLDVAVAPIDLSWTVQRHLLAWWTTRGKRLLSTTG